jgi:hypothetical protein
MDLVFSAKPGFIEHGKDVNDLVASLHSLLNTAQFIAMYPIMKVLYIPSTNRAFSLPPRERASSTVSPTLKYANTSPMTSKEPKSDNLQFITDYRYQEGEVTHPKATENEAVEPILAECDTTSTVLNTAVLYVTANHAFYAHSSLSSTPQLLQAISHRRSCSMTKLCTLLYLGVMIQESLRIHPPSDAPMPRATAPFSMATSSPAGRRSASSIGPLRVTKTSTVTTLRSSGRNDGWTWMRGQKGARGRMMSGSVGARCSALASMSRRCRSKAISKFEDSPVP